MFHEALKKITSGKNLTVEESRIVFTEILEKDLPDLSIAAFLAGLRGKGESTEEILGCVQVLREKGVTLTTERDHIVDTCGTGGDGAQTFNISTAAAFVAAGAGVAIAKHGNRSVSSQCGSSDVLEALGLSIDLEPARSKQALDQIGLTFLFAPKFHPILKKLASLRKELGFKTIFNIAGPLANPVRANQQSQVVGVFEDRLVPVVAEVLNQLGVKNAMVVRSQDGLDEISNCDETKIAYLKNNKIKIETFSPKDVNYSVATLKELKGESATENALIIKKILDGEKGATRDVVVLNAAAACLVGEKAKTIEEAVTLAEKSLDSGSAKNKLEELKLFLNEVHHVTH